MYKQMIKSMNIFGALTSEAGIREFFKPEILDWSFNEFTSLYVITENGSFRASCHPNELVDALTYYANRIANRNLQAQ